MSRAQSNWLAGTRAVEMRRIDFVRLSVSVLYLFCCVVSPTNSLQLTTSELPSVSLRVSFVVSFRVNKDYYEFYLIDNSIVYVALQSDQFQSTIPNRDSSVDSLYSYKFLTR